MNKSPHILIRDPSMKSPWCSLDGYLPGAISSACAAIVLPRYSIRSVLINWYSYSRSIRVHGHHQFTSACFTTLLPSNNPQPRRITGSSAINHPQDSRANRALWTTTSSQLNNMLVADIALHLARKQHCMEYAKPSPMVDIDEHTVCRIQGSPPIVRS